jgi:hypothetical protein
MPDNDIRRLHRGFSLEAYETNMEESVRESENDRLAFLAAERMSSNKVRPVPVGQFRLQAEHVSLAMVLPEVAVMVEVQDVRA